MQDADARLQRPANGLANGAVVDARKTLNGVPKEGEDGVSETDSAPTVSPTAGPPYHPPADFPSAHPIGAPVLDRRVAPEDSNALNALGEKIFLDRYALKDMDRANLRPGDTVVVCVNTETGQREIGKALAIDAEGVTVQLGDGEAVTRAPEHVDRPLEVHPDQMQARVARGIAALEPEAHREAWEARFRWLLEGWKFVPGGRILAAAGTEQALTFYNCYVVPCPGDSREGIIRTLSNMTEIMSRGGGVGINISSLRPRYAPVRGVNGRSSGSVSWGSLYSFVTGLIEQGGSRRGALMLILNVSHPDVDEFIGAKREAGRITNANISVGITDAFMEAVQADADWDLVFPDTEHADYAEHWNGDLNAWQAAGRPVVIHKTVRARALWDSIVESAWASAEPGLWFIDRSNKMSNSWYYAPLVCTNPCVTGDTLIATGSGLRRARELFESQSDLAVAVDGRFGEADTLMPASPVFRTGRKPVFRLRTHEGYSLRATADHRIMTAGGWRPLAELEPGDKLHILNRKGGFGSDGSLERGKTLGWLVGDGTLKSDRAVLSFFGREKQELAPAFAQMVNELVAPLTATARKYPVGVIEVADRDEARVQSARLLRLVEVEAMVEEKHRVPDTVLRGSEDMQRGFLQALFTADGSFQDGGEKGGSARLASSYASLLEETQILLANFGIASRIYRDRRSAGLRDLPDGKGGSQAYACRAQHELVISKQNLLTFGQEIGFLSAYKQDALTGYCDRLQRGPYAETFTATVQSVTAEGIEEVFDLTEPRTHSFIAGGIVVHNCGEQPLPGWSVCNLGALNLSRFATEAGQVNWDELGTAVRYAVRFLDDVIDATPYFFETNRDQQLSERRVGLGTMGLAELMVRCKVRYGSDDGKVFLDQLYGFIAEQAYLASADNAAEKGSFPHFDAEKHLQSGFMQGMSPAVRDAVATKGIRNVTLLTQAPTGTTGTMVSTSTGIEPFFSWTYYRKSRLGWHEETVEALADWERANPGQERPDYFVTSMELSPEAHVTVQAAIQRWVDSSISKTCNVPNDYTIEQTRDLYELMWRLGCKGGTVYRDGSRDEQVLHLTDEREGAKDEAKVGETAQPAVSANIPETPGPAASDLALAIADDEGLTASPSLEIASPPPVHDSTMGRRIQSRPALLVGHTYRMTTPVGKAYVTVNRSESGDPFEVFVNLGKAGSDLAADAEALGRLISLILRMPSPLSAEERVENIVSNLVGIGGSRSIGFGIERLRSLPDGIARALEQDLFAGRPDQATGTAATLADPGDPPPLMPGADLCPICGHATFLRVEGCQKCFSCGHSEC